MQYRDSVLRHARELLARGVYPGCTTLGRLAGCSPSLAWMYRTEAIRLGALKVPRELRHRGPDSFWIRRIATR